MAKKQPGNHRDAWETKDVRQLKSLVRGNTPTRLIALKMGRTTGAVYQKAFAEGIALKPTNQSPYGTKKKR